VDGLTTGVKFREKFLSATFFLKESGQSIHVNKASSGAVRPLKKKAAKAYNARLQQ
jgi:hypothetical protein